MLLPIGIPIRQALRGLHCLSRYPGRWVLASELAPCADVPAPTLSKVMNHVVRAGLVEAKRGLGGGYRLVADPSQTPLLAVIQAFGRLPKRGACALSRRDCDPDNPCPIHDFWTKRIDDAERVLSSITLGDYFSWRDRFEGHTCVLGGAGGDETSSRAGSAPGEDTPAARRAPQPHEEGVSDEL